MMDMNEQSEFNMEAEQIARSFHATLHKYAPGIELEYSPLLHAVVRKLLIDGVIEPGNNLQIGFRREIDQIDPAE